MRTNSIVCLLIIFSAVASVGGCGTHNTSGPDVSTTSIDNSTVPSRKCNPSLVTNPNFLGRNEGVAGAGQPELPGQAAASDCPP
jgi:hypothetical protein